MVVGPYLRREMTPQIIETLLERHHLPPELSGTLHRYYASLTYIENMKLMMLVLNTLGETLWGSKENFSVEMLQSPALQEAQEAWEMQTEQADIHLLEERYAAFRM